MKSQDGRRTFVISLLGLTGRAGKGVVTGDWWLVTGAWWLVAGDWWLVTGDWWLVACGWCLVPGGWWLVTGDWWLVAGAWWLVAGDWSPSPRPATIEARNSPARPRRVLTVDACEWQKKLDSGSANSTVQTYDRYPLSARWERLSMSAFHTAQKRLRPPRVHSRRGVGGTFDLRWVNCRYENFLQPDAACIIQTLC